MSRVIGLLGGTFDPIHNAHIHLAMTAREKFHLDEVRLMPANIPPHKSRPDLTAAEHRKAMCQQASASMSGLGVETIELDREGPSFSIDTLRLLCQREPEVTWRLIMGADMLTILHSWKDAPEVIRLGHPIIACRPGCQLESDNLRQQLDPSLAAYASVLSEGYLELPPMQLSSTEIRAKVKRGECISTDVPASVAAYIDAHRLYGKA